MTLKPFNYYSNLEKGAEELRSDYFEILFPEPVDKALVYFHCKDCNEKDLIKSFYSFFGNRKLKNVIKLLNNKIKIKNYEELKKNSKIIFDAFSSSSKKDFLLYLEKVEEGMKSWYKLFSYRKTYQNREYKEIEKQSSPIH